MAKKRRPKTKDKHVKVTYACPRCGEELLPCDYLVNHGRWQCWGCKTLLESYEAISVTRDGVTELEVLQGL